MSWPVRVQDHSYQVCPGCGIKRLFDEQAFRAYGPYNYDLHRLLAWDREQQSQDQQSETQQSGGQQSQGQRNDGQRNDGQRSERQPEALPSKERSAS